MITQKELKQLLHYDPDTGVFTWLVSCGTVKSGSMAGSIKQPVNGKFYKVIGISRSVHRSHRLAYLYMTGEWPDQIDHINGDGTDNRWCNLKNVDGCGNSRNQRQQSNNKSNVTGVYLLDKVNPWCSKIGDNGKVIHLGYFEDFFEAVCARKSAENKLGFHVNHGSVRPL